MAYLNEVTPATISEWLNNFKNCSDNIFDKFQEYPIKFSRSAYEAICADKHYYINIYFGMDEDENPKIIAVGSYLLDGLDVVKVHGFSDILDSDKIYELYSDSVISLELARQYTAKWKNENGSSSLYLYSALLPSTNFIKLFVEDKAEYVRIFFGMEDNKLKVMEKYHNVGDMAVVVNSSFPCPFICPKFGLLTD